jgi:cation-transporting ATPase E
MGACCPPRRSAAVQPDSARHDGIAEASPPPSAGVVAMVPEGLVLLTSVAFAASVVRLGRQQVLVQELPAVETLARVDVICLDKTGTITAGDIAFTDLEVAGRRRRDLDGGVGARRAGRRRTPTPTPPWPPSAERPVVARAAAEDTWDAASRSRSRRPASGAARTSTTQGLVGARRSRGAPRRRGARARPRSAAPGSGTGRARPLSGGAAQPDRRPQLAATSCPRRPRAPGARAAGRPGAPRRPRDARLLRGQDVRVKVISGDNPTTVAAVAREAGVPDVGDGYDGTGPPRGPGGAGRRARRPPRVRSGAAPPEAGHGQGAPGQAATSWR